MTGGGGLKRTHDTKLASVTSLRARDEVESTNVQSLRKSAVRSAVARKQASPENVQEPETVDFDANAPLDDATIVVPAPPLEAAEQSLGPTQVSNANTEALNSLVAQLETEQAEKKRLAEEIVELTAITMENQKIIASKIGDAKMVSQGQRYLLNSSTNVMTHPDNQFGKHLYHGL